MPTYLYRNLETGDTFEYEQRISDDALTTHPVTGAPVKRLVQPVGIAFKGSGFYVNDSRRPGSGGGTKPDATTKDAAAPSAPAASAPAASTAGSPA